MQIANLRFMGSISGWKCQRRKRKILCIFFSLSLDTLRFAVQSVSLYKSMLHMYWWIDDAKKKTQSIFEMICVCVVSFFFFFNFIAFSLVFNSIICYFKCVQEPIRLRPRECMCVTVCKSFSVSFGLSMCVRVFLFDARHTRNIKNKIK